LGNKGQDPSKVDEMVYTKLLQISGNDLKTNFEELCPYPSELKLITSLTNITINIPCSPLVPANILYQPNVDQPQPHQLRKKE